MEEIQRLEALQAAYRVYKGQFCPCRLEAPERIFFAEKGAEIRKLIRIAKENANVNT